MIGDDKQVGRGAQGRFWVSQQLRRNVTVRADQVQVFDLLKQTPGKPTLRGFGGKQRSGSSVQSLRGVVIGSPHYLK